MSLFIRASKFGNWCNPININFILLILFGYITNDTVGKNELKVSIVETVSEIKNVISAFFVWSFDGHVQAINRIPFDSGVELFDYTYKSSTRECVN